MSTHDAAKALIIAGGAAAMISLMPHCDVLGPLLGGIGAYLASVSPNLFSSAIEQDHAAADEAANYLHNEQVAGHVATVAGAVLDAFAKTSQPPVQAQLTALAAKLPEFWLQLHHDAAPGIAPLDGQEFIAHLAEVLTQSGGPARAPRGAVAARARCRRP